MVVAIRVCGPAGWWTLLAAAAYLFLVLGSRRYQVWFPQSATFWSQIRRVQAQIGVAEASGQSARRTALIDTARQLVVQAVVYAPPAPKELSAIPVAPLAMSGDWPPSPRKGAGLFWLSQARQGSGRKLLAEAEHTLVLLASDEELEARAIVVHAQLDTKSPAGKAIGAQISETVKAINKARAASAKNAGANAVVLDQLFDSLRPLVAEGQRLVAEDEWSLTDDAERWARRGFLMTLVLLAIVVVLAFAFGEVWVLLLGAAGGALSRVWRVMSQRRVRSDGFSSWPATFLAVPVGAIVAFAGLLLIDLLVSVNILNEETFEPVTKEFLFSKCTPSTAAMVLALAFLLGFTERFFNSLTAKALGAFEEPTEGSATPTVFTVPDPKTPEVTAGASTTPPSGDATGDADNAGVAATNKPTKVTPALPAPPPTSGPQGEDPEE